MVAFETPSVRKIGQRPAAAVALEPQPVGEAITEIVYNSNPYVYYKRNQHHLKPELKGWAGPNSLSPKARHYLRAVVWGDNALPIV